MSDSPWIVPLSDLRVDDALVEAAHAVVASGWWSMGPRVGDFEAAFADYVGTPHAIAVSNGTAALHLALLAAGCGPGDEVVLPSLNFVAAANTVVRTGAEPVFCDVHGKADLNLDPEDVDRAIGPRCKAVVVLHYGGHPCDIAAVSAIAAARGVTVIEDAAHAPGARAGGRMCGTFGAIGCFSFFSNKNLPVGEGGMVVTSDDELASRIRLLRSHGMTTLTWDRHRGHASDYDVVTAGFNYRLDELRAAVGRVQLERLESSNAARAQAVAKYRNALHGTAGITVPFPSSAEGSHPAHHLAVVLLPEGSSRDEIRRRMRDQGVQTSVHYPPIHSFTLYASRRQRSLPRTDEIAGQLLTLPLFPHLADSHISLVCEALTDAVAASRESSRT